MDPSLMAVFLFLALSVTALLLGPMRHHRVGLLIMSLGLIPPQESFSDYLTKTALWYVQLLLAFQNFVSVLNTTSPGQFLDIEHF